jgi:hypothetical protein
LVADVGENRRGRCSMKRLLIALAFLATLFMVASPAVQAQTSDYKKKKAFIFKGDDIWGEILRPGGGFITAAKQPVHGSLIEYRLDFKPEMLKLTEEL